LLENSSAESGRRSLVLVQSPGPVVPAGEGAATRLRDDALHCPLGPSDAGEIRRASFPPAGPLQRAPLEIALALVGGAVRDLLLHTGFYLSYLSLAGVNRSGLVVGWLRGGAPDAEGL